MERFDEEIHAAGNALRDLAEGPAAEAARKLEAVFEEAGGKIEATLAQAARQGELDFERMAEAILRDLARIAAQTVLGGGAGASAPVINLNWRAGADSRGRDILTSQGAIGAALARAVGAGGRFL